MMTRVRFLYNRGYLYLLIGWCQGVLFKPDTESQREVWIINSASSLRTIIYQKGIQAGVFACDGNRGIVNILYCSILAKFKMKTRYRFFFFNVECV